MWILPYKKNGLGLKYTLPYEINDDDDKEWLELSSVFNIDLYFCFIKSWFGSLFKADNNWDSTLLIFALSNNQGKRNWSPSFVKIISGSIF